MSLRTVTFRVPDDKLQALDSVAEIQQRDRSFVLNEAVAQYLSLHAYHRDLIEQGLREDEAGDLVDHEQVRAMVAGLVGKKTRKTKAR